MDANLPLPFPESARRFWHHLVPVTLFGPFALALVSFSGKTKPIVVVAFFSASFYAMWPWLTRRAKYSFWIAACGLYLAGGIVAALAGAVIRAFLPTMNL
jgi:hypothetical protein